MTLQPIFWYHAMNMYSIAPVCAFLKVCTVH
eukprot:CAMPEP_0173246354 /NCGR_PEP_ID=MMETSP1142-20121109/17273_1 /TAXON_ID=483371 /ORGANISM="non described non described, Strain CCMP2298" /LENGTH=30 /DNA_ID= /DNA_START= /DNA_END= /DNA_ORIENTATION=